jgi:transcriptional/translational regulatory protein YebC/TACO1
VAAISLAKAASAPSALIDRAIARGMGRSESGAVLERVTLEVVAPGGIAVIVETETDSKRRTLQEVSSTVKKAGAKLGSTLFYFDYYGRITLDADEARSREDDLFQLVLEGKALDLDIAEGDAKEDDAKEDDAVVWTTPEETVKVAKILRDKLGLQTRGADLVWRSKNDMKASLRSEQDAVVLNQLLAALQDFPEVNATFVNAERGMASAETWESIQENIILR